MRNGPISPSDLYRAALPSPRKTLAVAVSTALVSHALQAQQAIEEVVVTATKREANIQDIPQSITAFTDADLTKRGLNGFEDYAKLVPGLSFGKREPSGTSIVFRGVASSGLQFGARPSSAVYLDEQPITAGGINPDPRLVDVERVEALSGPQGTLFGDASQSGTLRIITNKPKSDEFDSWIEASGNNVDHGDFGYDVSGMVNIPVKTDVLAVRLVGFRAEDAGYIDNVLGTSPGGTFTNANDLKKNVNTVTHTGGRAAIRWTPNDVVTTDFSAIFQDTKTHGFGDVNLDVGDLQQVRFQPENGDDKWYQLGLTLEAKMDWADAVVNFSYFNRDFVYNADATEYQFGFQLASDAAGPYYTAYDFGGDPRGFAREKFNTKRYTVEARLATPTDPDRKWQGLVGFFYNRTVDNTLFSSGNDNFGNSPGFNYLNYLKYYYTGSFVDHKTNNWFFGQYDSKLQEAAVFGELNFNLTDNFTITLGGRWFRVEEDFSLLQGGLMQGSKPDRATDLVVTDESSHTVEHGFVPKVNLTYHLSDDKLIYFTYSEGFRSGGSNPVRRISILPRRFDSDYLDNFEWGAKTTWLDGRLRVNLAAYHMKWKNIQIQASDPQPFVFAIGYVNFPEATIDGIESAMEWVPNDNLDLTGTFTYNNARISKTSTLFPGSASPVVATEGTRLPLTPHWKAGFGAEYDFDREILGAKPFARFDWAYTGGSVNSLEGVEAVVFTSGVTPQKAYSTGDLRLGLESDLWSAAFYVNNLWDERGQIFFSNRWVKQRLSVNQPRTIGITFRRSFK